MSREFYQIILGLPETPVKAPQYRRASGRVKPSEASPATNTAGVFSSCPAVTSTGGDSSLPSVPFNTPRDQWIADEIAKANK